MPIFARIMFGAVNLAARRGLAGAEGDAKRAARQTGVRGETFAYWYLRRHGYVMIAKNFTVPGMHGEIDLVGRDGDIVAFIEVKLRTTTAEASSANAPGSLGGAGTAPQRALPEDAVTHAKRRHVVRIARQFLSQWRLVNAKYRFDVLAIESCAGSAPVVRLHKDAFAADA